MEKDIIDETRGSPQEMLVKQHFESTSEEWQSKYSGEDLHSRILQHRLDLVIRFLDSRGLKAGCKAIDLGCGAGLLSAQLVRRGLHVTAVDVSEAMLTLARKNCQVVSSGGHAEFVVSSAEELEFEQNSFDIVVAVGLIEYLSWGRWALQEMHRVLKPGGYLVVTVPNRRRLTFLVDPKTVRNRIEGKIKDTIRMVIVTFFGDKVFQKLKRFLKRYPNEKTASRANSSFIRKLYTPTQIIEVLQGVEFEVLDYITHGFAPFSPLKYSTPISPKIHRLLQSYSENRRWPSLKNLGNDIVLLCKKREISQVVGQRPYFAKIVQILDDFKSRECALFERRDAWLQEHPEYRGQDLLECVPEADVGPILVISPHPDDEIIGCGGTLIRHLELGVPVTIVQMTDGSETAALRGATEAVQRTIRFNEAKQVANRLGAELICWDERDGHLARSQRTVSKLSEMLEQLRPRMIFVPFLNDPNPVHIATCKILAEALRLASIDLESTQVVSYEVWALVPANYYCIIDDQFDKKSELLMTYRTGMKPVDYVHQCKLIHSFHAWTLLNRRGFVEAFLTLSANAYLNLEKFSE